MEIILKKSGKYRGVRVLLFCLFIFCFSATNQLVAQAVPDSTATTSASSDGFAKHENTAKVFEEAKKIQEANEAEQRRSDIITWVCMIVGFSLVIAIAWFTTALAKKRRIIEDEKRAKRVAMMQQQNPHRKGPRR